MMPDCPTLLNAVTNTSESMAFSRNSVNSDE